MSNHYKYIRANDRIRAAEVRLIGANGEQLGVVHVREAQKKAQEEGLDLVEVAATAKPPVCRILDFGKYIYSLKKKDKESRKKQKVISLKEIKMSSKIGENDYQTKLRNTIKFLSRGDKIKFTMFFRGREITHQDIGRKIITRFTGDIADVGEVERDVGLEGKTIHMYFQPLAESKMKAKAQKEKETKESDAKDTDNAKTQNQ